MSVDLKTPFRFLEGEAVGLGKKKVEILRLKSILGLNKGTEVFVSDLHGANETFDYLLKNGFGTIEKIVRENLGMLADRERNDLLGMIYAPNEALNDVKNNKEERQVRLVLVMCNLLKVLKVQLAVYPIAKIRSELSIDIQDMIIDMVLRVESDEKYVTYLVESIIELSLDGKIISELVGLIRRVCVQKLHVVGDIYDRGPGADLILDQLIDYQDCDVQWGNHDIVWMGAACGSDACIANVLRVSLRYGNIETLNRYGIHLIPLATFAMKYYNGDSAYTFEPRLESGEVLGSAEFALNKIMHKAIAIIQFKLEGALIKRREEFSMSSRLLLDALDLDRGILRVDGQEYPLEDSYFPTVDPQQPYQLNADEEELLHQLKQSFLGSIRLRSHARFLFNSGSLYKVSNNNLFFHGCVPVDSSGELLSVDLGEGSLRGKALFDFFDENVKEAWSKKADPDHAYAKDLMWYLWAGPFSPLFGKAKMATFERYFLKVKQTHQERTNAYFSFREEEDFCRRILGEFGLKCEESVVINGHMPVSVRTGENPIKGNSKLIVIDGGFSMAYQSKTGIGGFTLVHDSLGRQLTTHSPYSDKCRQINFRTEVISDNKQNQKIADSTEGKIIMERVLSLQGGLFEDF
ncbi:fructose-bisphosphatase class III [Reichenbachiella sp. 5M10]|uniref:fructose-bisphosphatase class III n=1 Tax=Reichenbachiella sp. 5M10 TaxID=1889772 RepID=UPI001C888326|nr:fructose-bisphosphatase class III [Reichenbachiella sp. 5M10]